jgi:hypothetical protein
MAACGGCYYPQCGDEENYAMTGDQSRLLNVGDRVCWNADRNDQGTVTEKNWAGVTVKWDNRSEQSILHNDMAQVERVPAKV